MEGLLARASRVFPGGKHTRWPLQQLRYGPEFTQKASGCKVVCTDGIEYIDFMAGFGATVLGYAHPVVDGAAAAAQARYGPTITGPTECSVLLSEKVTSLRPGATWSIF
eukprot:gene25452-7566_t